jgi:hypothetical protein
MIIVIQIIALYFGYFSAKHDAPAVEVFEDKGANPSQMKQFHGSNLIMKMIVAISSGLLMSVTEGSFSFELLWEGVAAVVLSFTCISLVFDPVLNMNRNIIRRPWYYMSDKDATGKLLIKWFGKSAGVWKAIICLVVIVGINLIFFL